MTRDTQQFDDADLSWGEYQIQRQQQQKQRQQHLQRHVTLNGPGVAGQAISVEAQAGF